MRRGFTHVLVCLLLLVGALCTYTCISQVEHECCHKGPTVAALQSHPPATTSAHAAPALPEVGFVFSSRTAPLFESLKSPGIRQSRSLPPLILRL